MREPGFLCGRDEKRWSASLCRARLGGLPESRCHWYKKGEEEAEQRQRHGCGWEWCIPRGAPGERRNRHVCLIRLGLGKGQGLLTAAS